MCSPASVSTITMGYNLGFSVDIRTIIRLFRPTSQFLFLKWGSNKFRYLEHDTSNNSTSSSNSNSNDSSADNQNQNQKQNQKLHDKSLKRLQKKLTIAARNEKKRIASGKKKPESQMFNQVSFGVDMGTITKENGKEVDAFTNVMLFRNGKITMTGCRGVQGGVDTILALIKVLSKIRGIEVVTLENTNGITYNAESNRVYSKNYVHPVDGLVTLGKCIGYFGDYTMDPTSKRKFGNGELFLYYTDEMLLERDTIEKRSISSISSTTSSTDIKYGYLRNAKLVVVKETYLIDKRYNQVLEKQIYCKRTLAHIGRKYIKFIEKESDKHDLVYKNDGVYIHTSVLAPSISVSKTFRIKLSIGSTRYRDEEAVADGIFGYEQGEMLHYIFDKYNLKVGQEYIEMFETENKSNPKSIFNTKLVTVNTTTTFEDYTVICKPDILANVNTPEYVRANLQINMINKDFSCEYLVDREIFLAIVQEKYNMLAFYDSEKNNGVRVWYYLTGECTCQKRECKCKTTATVYTSGRILLSGSSTIEECDAAYKFIKDIMEFHRTDLERNTFENTFEKVSKTNEISETSETNETSE